MALAPGTRLGPYEVTAQIGVGGMGEVYRATDTNLKRQVAIKVLPEAVATDPERLARFQREAEVLAALNHPNIAHIHGLEKTDGVTALVMELVEGPTLADRIARGPIAVDEALPIAKQIAEALEAAHEQGIIHRDLKPANIKVRDDGTVKVLDFGLAKAMDPVAGSSPNLSMSPTITTPAMTEMGMVLGTAAYMSPEQAKGKGADKRSDVWAFGAVLYEMLTGRRAFAGDDVSDTMASVLKADTDWDAFPVTVPATIVTVIKRCLQRDRDQRARDVGDVRLALEGAFETPTPPDARPARPAGRSVATLVAAAGVAGLLVGVIGMMVIRSSAEAPSSPGLTRRLAMVMTVDGTPLEVFGRPSLDAAGRLIVLAARGEDGVTRLFARRFDQTDAVPIRGTDGASTFALSPDGAWLAFVANQQLRKVAMSGGAPIALAPMPAVPGGLAWVRTDSLIVGGPTGLVRVPAGGGPVEPMTAVAADAGQVDHRWPSVTSDGRTLAYVVWMGQGTESVVHLRSLETGTERTIGPGEAPVLVRTGHLVFGRSATLWAMPIDRQTLEPLGESAPVQEGIASTLTGQALFAVSDDGALVYIRRVERALPMDLVDRTGATIGTFGESFDGIRHGPFDFSPDGQFLAVTHHPTNGGDQIVVYDLRRTGDGGIGLGSLGDSRGAVWTPDGTRLTFYSTQNGNADIFEVPRDFSSGPEPLLVRDGDQVPLSWTPDGRVLAFQEGPTGSEDIWLLPRDGDPVPLLANPDFAERNARFSPDGRWLAYASDESGRPEVYVQGYPTPGRRWKISTAGGFDTRWAADGLYYSGPSDIYFVPIAPGADFPASVVPQRLVGDDLVAVSPDGQTFVALQEQQLAIQSAGRLALVTNWFEELSRLVPIE